MNQLLNSLGYLWYIHYPITRENMQLSHIFNMDSATGNNLIKSR